MTDDLRARAVKIFGTNAGAVCWPSGLVTPGAAARLADPAGYRRMMAELEPRQRAIVDWAERHQLKRSMTGCCPNWLLRNGPAKCGMGKCANERHWTDHAVYWTHNRKPVALTTAPYNLDDDDRHRISLWTGLHPELSAAYGDGWYGYSSTQVVLWRSDRHATIQPVMPQI